MHDLEKISSNGIMNTILKQRENFWFGLVLSLLYPTLLPFLQGRLSIYGIMKKLEKVCLNDIMNATLIENPLSMPTRK